MPPETPLPNSPEARTPTGEIKDPNATSSTTPEPKPEPKAAEPEPKVEPKTEEPAEGETLLTKKDEPPEAGAPEKYEAFKVPDGYELDEKVFEEASTLFKELGLSQDAAQRLVDYYAKRSIAADEAGVKEVNDMRAKWIADAKADPEIGSKLSVVKTTVSRALDGLGDAKLASDFRAAMDLTGAGNHPAFIKVMYKWAEQLTEGGFVKGGGPSPAGQKGPNDKPADAAHALYPNLA